MSLSLEHNGFNLQRRKMYPVNPRNNLISTVDLLWKDSLAGQRPTKKDQEADEIRRSYDRAVMQQIEEDMRLNKSSFRVMPAPSRFQDSLNDLEKYGARRREVQNEQIVVRDYSQRKPVQNSSQLSKSVFGYTLDYEPFKKESYLGRIYGDRHDAYLEEVSPQLSPSKRRHMAFTINSPVLLNY